MSALGGDVLGLVTNPLGATEGSRPKPAKAGFLWPGKKPAFGQKKPALPGQERSRLPPASAGSFPRRPKETEAGESRLLWPEKPALSARKAGFLARKEPA